MFTKAIVGFDGSERALDAHVLAESLISRDGELLALSVCRACRVAAARAAVGTPSRP
jgi:hypothetical protein